MSTATRLADGRRVWRTSTDLAVASLNILVMPVMFPPGRANDLMKPDLTGSEADAITIGIVEVARWAATTAGVATATITSGRRASNSLISDGKRSIFPSAYLVSMMRFLLSM